jgi:hypothetical protein
MLDTQEVCFPPAFVVSQGWPGARLLVPILSSFRKKRNKLGGAIGSVFGSFSCRKLFFDSILMHPAWQWAARQPTACSGANHLKHARRLRTGANRVLATGFIAHRKLAL